MSQIAIDPHDDGEPCDERESCLAEKLRRLAPLSPEHRRLLDDLEKERRERAAGEIVVKRGQRSQNLLVVKKGWLLSEFWEDTGQRVVTKVHMPGDIIGADELAFDKTGHQVTARTRVAFCPFPRRNLDALFTKSPRLAGLIMAVASIEHAIYQDRLRIAARNRARSKVALFLMQTFSRLRLMNDRLRDRFHCPLTQSDIGDAVGLTSVHVSRTLSAFESEGLIERSKSAVSLRDIDALGGSVSFVDRYRDLDLSWLPKT